MNTTDNQTVLTKLSRELNQSILRAQLILRKIGFVQEELLTPVEERLSVSIMAAVTKQFGTTEEYVMGGSRESHIVDARHAFIWLLSNRTNISNARLGRFLHLKHGAVYHALNRVKNLMETEARFKQKLIAAEQDLKTE